MGQAKKKNEKRKKDHLLSKPLSLARFNLARPQSSMPPVIFSVTALSFARSMCRRPIGHIRAAPAWPDPSRPGRIVGLSRCRCFEHVARLLMHVRAVDRYRRSRRQTLRCGPIATARSNSTWLEFTAPKSSTDVRGTNSLVTGN